MAVTWQRMQQAATRAIPIVSWLPAYRREWLPRDSVAGFTIWGLLIPEMIAYASLAGLSPQAGLYTLLASLVLYAVFHPQGRNHEARPSAQLDTATNSHSGLEAEAALIRLQGRDRSAGRER